MVIRAFCAYLILCSTVLAATPRVVPESDLSYLGCFRPGDGELGYPTGIGFSPHRGGNGSIFVSFRNSPQERLVEISIPNTLSTAKTYAGVGASSKSTVLAGPTNISVVGNNLGTYPAMSGILYLTPRGGQSSAKLYLSFYDWYNTATASYKSLAYTSPTTLNTDNHGAWYIGGSGEINRSGRYLMEVPQTFADTYFGGRYILEGYFRGGGNNTSYGPTLYAIKLSSDWSAPSNGSTITPLKILEYNIGSELTDWTTGNSPMPDSLRGGAWVVAGSKMAVIFPSRRGTPANQTYTQSTTACSTGSGYVSAPYSMQWLWYDVDQLAEVAAGTRAANLTPFSRYTPTDTWGAAPCYNPLLSSSYDAGNSRLYVMEEVYSDGNPYPIIHVWRIGEGAPTAPPTGGSSPSQPTGLHVQ